MFAWSLIHLIIASWARTCCRENIHIVTVWWLSYNWQCMGYWRWAGRSGVRIPAGDREFVFSKTVQIGCMTHPVSYSIAIGVLSRGYNGRDVMLTSHFHLVQRLRISGAIPLLPLYAFMAWTRTTLPVPTAKCWENTSVVPRPIPSKSFPFIVLQSPHPCHYSIR
jgi:hypothetical protein